MSKVAAARAGGPRPMDRSIPVGLNEAALDSPAFRASAAHFAEQADALEKWLNGYVSSTTRLVHDILALEESVNSFLAKTMPSAADGIIENDYTFLALKRVGDGQRECWMQTLRSMKKMDGLVIEPIHAFLTGDLRSFKEARRVLEQTQRAYDSTLARYVGQSKTKEPSALREDAFSVYESRKAYVQASMDYCQLAPQLRYTVDGLLVKVCTEVWKEMKRSHDASANATRWTREMDRVHGWAKEMELSEGMFRRELQNARRELTETTLEEFKPSRELDDYSTSTVPILGSRGPMSVRLKSSAAAISEKQGWLFLRIMTGKPVRYSWARRWYYCRDGVFGWLTPGPQGVLQGDEIGVLLCNAKPAVGEDRRFSFEVKTKSQNMMLQAETQKELTEWMEVFEVAKRAAFETSMARDSGPLSGSSIDPAFSISPPSAPEFSAKALDHAAGASDDATPGFERSTTLVIPGYEGPLGGRQSLDANASLGRRSFTALGRDLATREEGESSREHAARIIQRLDLHRKNTFGAGVEPVPASSANPAGGIASLISASHNLLPVNAPSLATGAARSAAGGLVPSLDSMPGSLAPMTLARPPTLTSLSRTAVAVAGGRGSAANGRKLPTSVVANYWGSNVWATANRRQPRPDDDDDDDDGGGGGAMGVVTGESSQMSPSQAGEKPGEGPLPANYPVELRKQNAQFRLLFPDAPAWERLVLVFRAAWTSSKERDSPNETLSGDGRVFVTPDSMYFYSQQMGLVTAYSIHLDIITEMTTAAGRDCDFIFLHLGRETNGNGTGYTRIALKVFLDDLELLHTRLNLVVDNLQAEEPMDTGGLISALTSAEREGLERASPSAESWGEEEEEEDEGEGKGGGSSSMPAYDGTTRGGRSTGRQRGHQGHQGHHGHHGHHGHRGHGGPHRPHVRLPPKLQLPSQPVTYEPEGMAEMAAERHFEISAKACFHVLFGDKSFVFARLYSDHRAQQIAQGPWLLADQGRMRRDFRFGVERVDMLGRRKAESIDDEQRIDVYRDHVTYVVTHLKTAWHLPHSRSFRVVNKIVITHVAKWKCRLAVYVGIDWSRAPALSRKLVERQALQDAAGEAEELAELATEQVRGLGPRSRTKRAIEVYGQVGQQTQAVPFSPEAPEAGRRQAATRPRTLTAMALETARSFAESAVSSLIMWAVAGLRTLAGVVSAQRVLLALLALSGLANLALTSAESSAWLRERRAARFMRRVGVGPNGMMSRAVYLADLDEAAGAREPAAWWGPGEAGQVGGVGGGMGGGMGDTGIMDNGTTTTCLSTYRELVAATDMDAPWEEAGARLTWGPSRATARRLRRTRQRLGSHRHDLLVAMRVVNGMEREVVRWEWENWLVNEKALCDGLASLLEAGGGGGRGSSRAQRLLGPAGEGGKRRREVVEEWRRDHCGSCEKELEAVMAQGRAAGWP